MHTVQAVSIAVAFGCGVYAILKKSPEAAGIGVIALSLALALEVWPAT